MKTVKVKSEGNKDFEVKVDDKDLDTLIKVIWVFGKKQDKGN